MNEKIKGVKVSLVLILLTCLFLPFAGSYLFFNFRAKTIKKEISELILEGIDEDQLVSLTFKVADTDRKLNWKHSREFEYNGHMYDIVRQLEQDDSITYVCFPDHKETRLYQEKNKSIARALGQDPLQKKQNERIRNFFSNYFLQEIQPFNNVLSFNSLTHYKLKIKHYALIYLTPPYPPPKYS